MFCLESVTHLVRLQQALEAGQHQLTPDLYRICAVVAGRTHTVPHGFALNVIAFPRERTARFLERVSALPEDHLGRLGSEVRDGDVGEGLVDGRCIAHLDGDVLVLFGEFPVGECAAVDLEADGLFLLVDHVEAELLDLVAGHQCELT